MSEPDPGRPSSTPARRALAVLFARVVLGLIFFQAGVWKVFVLTPAGHARKWFLPFADTFLPVWSLWAIGVTRQRRAVPYGRRGVVFSMR